ncbi:ABC transporter ATP-binding protein [Paralcaligenes ureilyticus]|uniref:Amino acid/amide ABC transporter ATP-binding protein 1 (HAAT family) n=1 Tax=Paralcaligenes ureilyticus TaxID=627131 RepID=A0A4R3MA82_9BURK|nr:ABC transporter ATP-binding protein [Paralcaligenes ureilyticus]TCT09573.1 amino acid/amide ABC transporter ATP-binding protein 1 (HAAT family) [Paralcaligenes ureilyticus]
MILQTHSLSKSFGGLQAVSDVSLTVKAKSIHSVLGPNGAGKTTLFNLITGAIRPASGTVQFDGKEITGWSPNRLAEIGVVRTFQRTSIFRGLSTLENVALAIRSHRRLNYKVRVSREISESVREEALRCLHNVGLGNREAVMADNLAHGYQRALDIAIGLALKPKLILMDEPLAGMSRGDRQGIADLILKLRDEFGLTIVIVEHDVGMVMKLSDIITVMQNGRVIAEGPPASIREDSNVKKAYLHGSFAS